MDPFGPCSVSVNVIQVALHITKPLKLLKFRFVIPNMLKRDTIIRKYMEIDDDEEKEMNRKINDLN